MKISRPISLMSITSAIKPLSASSALISRPRCPWPHRTTLHVYTGVHGPVFLLCLEYLGSRVVPLSPCLPPPPHHPIAFFISRIAKENKHLGSHCQKTLESLFHHFSRWESWRGDKEKHFFSFSINFHFFQVWVNAGHRATRMMWLWKLLISPSNESQLMVTARLARSSKGLLQHDPSGSLWVLKCSGYNLWQLLKDRIILECFMSCSGKLCFPTTALKKTANPH